MGRNKFSPDSIHEHWMGQPSLRVSDMIPGASTHVPLANLATREGGRFSLATTANTVSYDGKVAGLLFRRGIFGIVPPPVAPSGNRLNTHLNAARSLSGMPFLPTIVTVEDATVGYQEPVQSLSLSWGTGNAASLSAFPYQLGITKRR